MEIKFFAKQDKGKPDTETIMGLNMAAVRFTTAQATELQLQHKLSKIRHDFIRKAWTDRGLAYAVNIMNIYCHV
jgi:hypothetical protein